MFLLVCNRCSKTYESRRRIHSYCSWACKTANKTRVFAENFDAIFWSRVDQSGGPDACWPWTAKINKRRGGYGVANLPGRKERRAHRVAYELAAGMTEPLSSDQKILHSCDNPPCCNPRHLSVGTQAENQADMAAKGRSLKGKPRP